MAFQIRPDRAHDSSAPISSAFREFSIYSLPEFLSSRLFTSPRIPLGSKGTHFKQRGATKEELNAPENSSRCSRDFWEI
jgi:hypothetical protein